MALEMLSRLPRGEGSVFWDKAPPTTKQVSKAMASLCERAGVPRRPAHCLRHCHASLLVALGVDIKSAQRRLGHATADMTLNTYAHHLPGQERAIAQALHQALDPRGAGP
jgi:integrase